MFIVSTNKLKTKAQCVYKVLEHPGGGVNQANVSSIYLDRYKKGVTSGVGNETPNQRSCKSHHKEREREFFDTPH